MVMKVNPTIVSKILVKPVDQKSSPTATISSDEVHHMTAQAPIEDSEIRAFGVIVEQQSQEDNHKFNRANRLSPDLEHLKPAIST